MDVVLQHAWNGLSAGSIYALIALGYTMVYGVLQLINFAHSDVFMVGSFAGWYLVRWLPGLAGRGVGFALALVVAMVVCTALGFVIERGAYRPLREAPRLNCLITAMGVSLLLENVGQNVFGRDPKPYPALLEDRVFTLDGRTDADGTVLGGVTITQNQLIVLGVAVLLMIALDAVVNHTRVGLGMRAVSENPQVAGLMGVPTNTIITVTFLIGASLAGAAGILYGVTYPKIDPIMGTLPGLKAFVAAVLGGIGSLRGAMVGGLVIGLSEAAVVGAGYSSFRDAIAFAILIVILLRFPTGLFGRFEPEKV